MMNDSVKSYKSNNICLNNVEVHFDLIFYPWNKIICYNVGGIVHETTPISSPQSNGKIERFHFLKERL